VVPLGLWTRTCLSRHARRQPKDVMRSGAIAYILRRHLEVAHLLENRFALNSGNRGTKHLPLFVFLDVTFKTVRYDHSPAGMRHSDAAWRMSRSAV